MNDSCSLYLNKVSDNERICSVAYALNDIVDMWNAAGAILNLRRTARNAAEMHAKELNKMLLALRDDI